MSQGPPPPPSPFSFTSSLALPLSLRLSMGDLSRRRVIDRVNYRADLSFPHETAACDNEKCISSAPSPSPALVGSPCSEIWQEPILGRDTRPCTGPPRLFTSRPSPCIRETTRCGYGNSVSARKNDPRETHRTPEKRDIGMGSDNAEWITFARTRAMNFEKNERKNFASPSCV